MTRAFIVSRPTDIDLARACKARMKDLGWEASIMVDPREWESVPDDTISAKYSTLGRGMFGNACATGITDGIIENSQPGDVVMKMDCDIWISHEASDWFSSPTKARATRIMYRKNIAWGGCWSATREHLQAARITADTIGRCNCPESYLNLHALALTEPRLEYHGTLATQWEGGERGFVATLPITRRRHRQTEGLALFDTVAKVNATDQFLH